MEGMTAGHFVFIPSVLLLGLVIGWVLGSRAAADAYAAELKRRGASGQSKQSQPVKTKVGQARNLLLFGVVAVMLSTLSSSCISNSELPVDNDSQGSQASIDIRRHLFDLGSVVIEALVAGDESAPVIILLTDAGQSALSFLDLFPQLASAGLRSVALNSRGIEGSLGSLADITMHDLASDVAGVIEKLDVGPVHVLGHGFGNRVARCLDADRPDLVEGLVLLGAGGQVPGDLEASQALARLYDHDMTDDETAVALQTALFAPGSDASVWSDLPLFPEVYRAQNAANRETVKEDWLFGGASPMLIIQGRHDRLAPPENGRWLRERLGERVQLVELADSAHALIPEQTVEIVTAIREFVLP